MPPSTDVLSRSADVTSADGALFVVNFARDGNSAAYRRTGWSGQEDGFVWSLGASSTLVLPGLFQPAALVLEIDFTICLASPGPSAAAVRVFANNEPVAAACAGGWTRLRCTLPAALITPGEPITLRFEHPNCARLNFIRPDGDDRLLGLCFYALRLFPPSLMEAMQRFAPRAPQGQLIEASPIAGADAPASAVTYRFAAGSPHAACLTRGWRHDPQGDAWAHERECAVTLPAVASRAHYIARFDIAPLLVRHLLPAQRITILLDGAVLGQFRLRTETSLVVPLPPELITPGEPLQLTLLALDGMAMHPFDGDAKPHFLSIMLDAITIDTLPARHAAIAAVRSDDAVEPSPLAVSERFLDESVEALPAAIQDALGVGIADVMRNFESLGDNCSFGLAQRKAGCEVMGLLRFANAPLANLLTALDDEFRALDDPSALSLRPMDGQHGEYGLFADRYGVRWHTNVDVGEADETAIFKEQCVRLRYLRRKFYEALRAGRKIFAVSRAEPRKHPVALPFAGEAHAWEEQSDKLRLAETLPLFLRLNEYGTNPLLFLTRCANGRRSGAVELLAPGIMRGYVDDFVITPDPEHKDHAAWMRVAANAWLLDKGPNADFRKKASS